MRAFSVKFSTTPSGETMDETQKSLTVGPLLPAKFHLDRLRGRGLRPPKLKKWSFTNIIAPKGRVSCTIFTKFAGYMRVLSLYICAKFVRFISINDKIINNLLYFSAKFSTPPSGKTMDWTQKHVGPKMMARTTSITMQNLVEIVRRTSA